MFIESKINFSVNVIKKLDPNKSQAFSPLSILSNSAVILAGCDGKAAEELILLLAQDKTKEEIIQHYLEVTKQCCNNNDSKMLISHCLFLSEKPLLSDFLGKMEKYGIPFHQLDFNDPKKCVESINNFVSLTTDGQINNIVTENDIARKTNMFITNALYFSAEWETPFKKSSAYFIYEGKRYDNVPFLKYESRKEGWNFVRGESWRCLGIPYKSRRNWFHILIPNSFDDLPELMKELDYELIKKCVTRKKAEKVDLIIPEFHITSNIPFIDIFKKLGVKEIFNVDSITQIFKEPQHIDRIIHASKIEVTTTGTVVAAATISRVVPVCDNEDLDLLKFFAYHPFIYFITAVDDGEPDKLNNIVLMGQYLGENYK